MLIGGANFRGGRLYLAFIEATSTGDTFTYREVPGTATSLDPSPGLAYANQIADTLSRLKQDLRVVRPSAVGLVATRLFNGWKYKNAYDRITMISALMIACHELDIEYQEVRTEGIAKLFDVAPKSLELIDFKRFGFEEAPPLWKVGRGAAFGAAAKLFTDAGEVSA